MTHASGITLTGAIVALTLAACGADDPIKVPEDKVAVVTVNPAAPTLRNGDTLRITASPRSQDGSVVNGVAVTWAADDDAVVALSGTGASVLLRAKAPGTSRITATAAGRTGEITVTVEPAAVASVEIWPANTQIYVGEQLELTAVLKDANGGLLGNRPVAWGLVGAGGSLQAHPHPLKTVLTTHASGALVVRATCEGVRGEAQVQVIGPQPPPAGIIFNPTIRTLQVGGSLAVHAELHTANGGAVTGYPITWASSNATILRVEPQATNGEATLRALAPGVAVIAAAGAGFQSNITFTVAEPPGPPIPVASVLVQPPVLGLWELQQRKLTARTLASNGLELPDRYVTWAAPNLQLLQVDAAGVVRAGSTAGVTKVYAESEGMRGEAEVHIYRIAPVLTFELTSDWWDGELHLMPPLAGTQWTDPQGQVRSIELYAESGSFTIDRDHGTYQRVIRAAGWALIDGSYRKVLQQDLTDSGTMVYRWQPYVEGASTFEFLSGPTAGLRFAGKLRAPGELLVTLPTAGGQLQDLLFRLP